MSLNTIVRKMRTGETVKRMRMHVLRSVVSWYSCLILLRSYPLIGESRFYGFPLWSCFRASWSGFMTSLVWNSRIAPSWKRNKSCVLGGEILRVDCGGVSRDCGSHGLCKW